MVKKFVNRSDIIGYYYADRNYEFGLVDRISLLQLKGCLANLCLKVS